MSTEGKIVVNLFTEFQFINTMMFDVCFFGYFLDSRSICITANDDLGTILSNIRFYNDVDCMSYTSLQDDIYYWSYDANDESKKINIGDKFNSEQGYNIYLSGKFILEN